MDRLHGCDVTKGWDSISKDAFHRWFLAGQDARLRGDHVLVRAYVDQLSREGIESIKADQVGYMLGWLAEYIDITYP